MVNIRVSFLPKLNSQSVTVFLVELGDDLLLRVETTVLLDLCLTFEFFYYRIVYLLLRDALEQVLTKDNVVKEAVDDP